MGSLAAAIILGGGAPLAAAAGWTPWLSLGGGHESDLILTGTPDRAVVAGGAFTDISGGISTGRDISPGSEFSCGVRANLERFLNDQRRLLFGQGAWAEIRRAGPGGLRLRLTGGGDYFDDSQRPQSRRLGGFVLAAAGVRGRKWRLETTGGVQGRRYPRLDSPDDSGAEGTYAEQGWNAGFSALLSPSSSAYLRASATVAGVDARDPWYDADGTTLAGDAWLRLRRGLWLTGRFMLQRRNFDERPDGSDSDRYVLAGCGIESPIGNDLTLSLRYAFANYEPATGDDAVSHRFSAAVTWRPGGPPAERRAEAPAAEIPSADRPHLFRIHAPDAAKVSIVGSFNGWNPGAAPMARAGGGWWEASVLLPAGTHQYAYLVDGEAVTPPESEIVIDDGFGGGNGLIRVQPAGL